VVRRLNAEAEALAAREVETALARLRHLSPPDQETVRELARSLRTKLLMPPTLALRTAKPRERAGLARAAARLFGFGRKTRNGAGMR
jgi:glutamyl-tRNA reductase